ncbi:DUF1365 domain-containing protein [Paraburkholderia sp. A1RI-2L]|uniref:DUF1365 domain-containing protein n=1 Tax=Paraburkholderia sp. A1RI-2L TaxID=3028367 RepID=UPI003BA18E5E
MKVKALPDTCHAHAASLLTGRVTHARLRPVTHRFAYSVFYVRCDLGRLAQVERWWLRIDRWAPLGLATRDYGPRDGRPLEAWMRERLAEADIPADGPIWLQTMPRLFGYAFNPVSFWFCHDRTGALRALYADVRNTFGGHHGSLLSAPGHGPIGDDTLLICRKTFHVSPFCDVKGRYEFRVRQDGERIAIDYADADGPLLRTALRLRAKPLTGTGVLSALIRLPLAIVAVIPRIHWQALRLWLKRVPFYGSRPPSCESGTSTSHSITHSPRHDEDTCS